ncbi:MAG: hypothetical protein J5525_08120 [Lachnospiraceae bacterium]|nr:hypothetical protein [Lachnospiraceae bacterium]
MKKGLSVLIVCILALAFILGGCSKSEGKNASITSNWTLKEFTVNGKTVEYKDMDEETKKIAPAFSCTDGENCVVSNNGKDHPGKITQSDGQYIISFDDTDQALSGQISGDTLTLVNTKNTVTFVFVAN